MRVIVRKFLNEPVFAIGLITTAVVLVPVIPAWVAALVVGLGACVTRSLVTPAKV